MNGGESRAFSAEQFQAYCEFINEVAKTAIIIGNVSVPSIPQGFRVMIATLKIDAGDLFPTQWFSDEDAAAAAAKPIWGWSATVMDQIARAAGVRWDLDRCRQLDDGKDPNRFEYGVEGEVFDLCGRKIPVVGKYEIDFGEFRAEEYQKAQDRWDKSVNGKYKSPPRDALPNEAREAFANRKADAAERGIRKVKLRRGETGARNRAVAKAFGLRRGGWVKNDVLAKVLLVARLEPIIDFDANPEIGRALAYDTLGILGTLAKTGQGDTLRQLIMGRDTREQRPALEVAAKPTVLQLPSVPTPPPGPAEPGIDDEKIDHQQHDLEHDEGDANPDDVVIEHGETTVVEPKKPEAQKPVVEPEPAKVRTEPVPLVAATEPLLSPETGAKSAEKKPPKSSPPEQTPPDVETFKAIPLPEKQAWVADLIDRKKHYPADRIRKSDVQNLTNGMLDELYSTLYLRADR